MATKRWFGRETCLFLDNNNNIWEVDLSEGIGRVNENVVSKRHKLNSVPKIIKGLDDDMW